MKNQESYLRQQNKRKDREGSRKRETFLHSMRAWGHITNLSSKDAPCEAECRHIISAAVLFLSRCLLAHGASTLRHTMTFHEHYSVTFLFSCFHGCPTCLPHLPFIKNQMEMQQVQTSFLEP